MRVAPIESRGRSCQVKAKFIQAKSQCIRAVRVLNLTYRNRQGSDDLEIVYMDKRQKLKHDSLYMYDPDTLSLIPLPSLPMKEA